LVRKTIFDVCVIGAGPSGLMAAITAAKNKSSTLLLESQDSPGKKLLLTGGGRCNFTHLEDTDQLLKKYGKNGRFLSYAVYEFPPDKVIKFFEKLGIRTKIEIDGCAFPESDNADDILNFLLNEIKNNRVTFIPETKVISIKKDENIFIIITLHKTYYSKRVIIATGGLSFPSTGSDGDGYNFARSFAHTITPPIPSLVPVVVKEKYINILSGVSLQNIKVAAVLNTNKICISGDILFTHNGLSGPAILNLSKEISRELNINKKEVKIVIDLIPYKSENDMDKYVLSMIKQSPNKQFVSVINNLLPDSLSKVIFMTAGLDHSKTLNQITKTERKRLIFALKNFTLTITHTLPIETAIVTQGGINITEIDNKTMESKFIQGLFFAGELLDIDGLCGGYNLQMCWSTGRLAGLSVSKNII
jgi:predicted Rossmann fold flavoprotein